MGIMFNNESRRRVKPPIYYIHVMYTLRARFSKDAPGVHPYMWMNNTVDNKRIPQIRNMNQIKKIPEYLSVFRGKE
jgi:hypothetical protein